MLALEPLILSHEKNDQNESAPPLKSIPAKITTPAKTKIAKNARIIRIVLPSSITFHLT